MSKPSLVQENALSDEGARKSYQDSKNKIAIFKSH